MANPAIVTCTKNQWVKVATAVHTGQIHKLTEKPIDYLSTYRETGDTAPTLKSEGVRLFFNNENSALISSGVDIDVYIYADGEDGKVRVDL